MEKMLVVCDKDYKISGKLKIREEQEPNQKEEEVLIREKSLGIKLRADKRPNSGKSDNNKLY